MSTIDEAFPPTGLTIKPRQPFDWAASPLTCNPVSVFGEWWLRTQVPPPLPSRMVKISITSGEDGALEVLADVLSFRLNELLAMRPGWLDGRGNELSDEAVVAAVEMVFEILRDKAVPPQFFPLPDGGIQFEWHLNGNSVEVEVEPDGSAFAVAETADKRVVIEEDVEPPTVQSLRQFVGAALGVT